MPSRPVHSRRSFLRLSAAAAWCGPQIVASGVLRGATAPSRRLNVAVIGCGNRSRTLIPALLEEGVNIAALCDVEAAQMRGLKSGAPARDGKKRKGGDFASGIARAREYGDFRRLLEGERNLDAVVIAVGQRWHQPMSAAALGAGRHVFCEKPLAHSVAEARAMARLVQGTKLVTQVGTQGGATDAFRRSMEIIQVGLLGPVREVHCWMDRTFPPSTRVARDADPLPADLNWDAWCGPSSVHPFKEHYLGGCLQWGRWLDYGDGHLADMGAHAHNLPLRALELGAPVKVAVKSSEPALDSYPAENSFRWDFAARGKYPAVSVWWHDGPRAAPPAELTRDLVATYGKVPTNGCLFLGEKGILCADAWGQKGVMRLRGDASPKCRGVLDHEAQRNLPAVYPRTPGQNHLAEFLEACKGGPPTFQNFEVAARAAEFGMTGIVALRVGREITWDSAALKAPGCPEADRWIHLPQRRDWLA